MSSFFSTTVSNYSKTFTVKPSSNFTGKTTYKIKVTTLVKDTAGNSLNNAYTSTNGFTTADVTAPLLAEVTAITSPTSDSTPNYTFSSTEAGTITYGGSCSSSTTSATTDNNTITFITLSDGTYSNCTITVKDNSSNSSTLSIKSFSVSTVSIFGTSLIDSSYFGE